MDPNYSEYHNERGSVYLQMGRFDEAIADYRKAIEVSPPYPEAWTNLGQCYRRMGRFPDAAEAYSRALDLDPHFRLALVGRADSFVRLERWSPALADYDTLLAINPKQPLVLANRAAVLGQLGQLEKAVTDLSSALGLAPQEAVLYQNRASAWANWAHREGRRGSPFLPPVTADAAPIRSKKSSPRTVRPHRHPTVETTRGGAPRWRTRLRSRVDCPHRFLNHAAVLCQCPGVAESGILLLRRQRLEHGLNFGDLGNVGMLQLHPDTIGTCRKDQGHRIDCPLMDLDLHFFLLLESVLLFQERFEVNRRMSCGICYRPRSPERDLT